MPTEQEIQKLIERSENAALPEWRKTYVKRIADNLQVHTKGLLFSKVDTLFPNEHPASKEHCRRTYEPITKSSIWKGITNIIRIFNNSSFKVNVSETVHEWLEGYQYEGKNLFSYFLEKWVMKAVAEDPNGLFVIYPLEYAAERQMSPIQFVRSEMIRACEPDFVSFVSEIESEVDYTLQDTVTKREIFYDKTVDALNAITHTEITYNQQLKATVKKRVQHTLTKQGFLRYVENGKGKFDYEYFSFQNELTLVPAFIAGGSEVEKEIYDSFVGPFVPFGNLALLQHRNHRAVDLMFSYPRMSEIQTACEHCSGGYTPTRDLETYPDGKAPCSYCKGSGFTSVQSPYKVYQRKYDPDDAGHNEHLKVPHVEFYSPDVQILTYSKDEWKGYLSMAERAIFITQEVQTGNVQSAESKGIDQEGLYAWLTNISKVFYDRLRIVLQVLEEYLNSSPIDCTVEQPFSFAVLTETEAFQVLNDIINSEAPVFVKANQVENFVSKFISKGSPVVRALDILKKVDLLLYYSNKDAQMFKSNNTISNELWTTHILAYPMLVRMYEQDKQLFEKEDKAIIDALKKELQPYLESEGQSLRQNLLTQFQRQAAPAAAPAAQGGGVEVEEEEEPEAE